jgi:hypothetical protein
MSILHFCIESGDIRFLQNTGYLSTKHGIILQKTIALIHTEMGNKNIPFLKLHMAFWQRKSFL